jgi:hypothetical protein
MIYTLRSWILGFEIQSAVGTAGARPVETVAPGSRANRKLSRARSRLRRSVKLLKFNVRLDLLETRFRTARRSAEAPQELIHLPGSPGMKEKARTYVGRPIPDGAASQRPGEIVPDSCGRSV